MVFALAFVGVTFFVATMVEVFVLSSVEVIYRVLVLVLRAFV